MNCVRCGVDTPITFEGRPMCVSCVRGKTWICQRCRGMGPLRDYVCDIWVCDYCAGFLQKYGQRLMLPTAYRADVPSVDLQMTDRWIDRMLEPEPPPARLLLYRYWRFHLRRRLARRLPTDARGDRSAKYFFYHARRVVRYLLAAEADLRAVDARVIDTLLAESTPAQRYAVNPFLRWLHNIGVAPPPPPRPTLSRGIASTAEFMLLLERLRDERIALELRTGAALATLCFWRYDQLVSLRLCDVRQRGRDLYLLHPEQHRELLIPRPVATLVDELASQRTRFIFRTRYSDAAICTQTLGQQIAKLLPCHLTQLRTYALADLLRTIPSNLIPVYFPVHPKTVSHVLDLRTDLKWEGYVERIYEQMAV